MKTIRDTEGYLLVDNRHSDPVPDELVIAAGLPPGAGRGLFETATYTCSHCQAQVVMNPSRTRERAYCRGCAHVICDGCAAEKARTLVCKTFEQRIDEYLNTVS